MRLIDADAAIEAVCEEVMDRFFVPPSAGYDVAEEALKKLPSIQPETNCSEFPNNSGAISRQAVEQKLTALVNELEEIFSHIREHNVDDSVCGLCEYDGAYMGQSGDWCNECPGFDRDDCFKLSDKTRKKWTDKIIKALPSAQPEQRWIPVSERLPDDLAEVNVTWVNHEPEPYYDFVKDKPFTASAVYYKGDWYWYSSVCTDLLAEYGENEIDKIDDAIEITAWTPLPDPYQKRGDQDGMEK